MNALFSAYGVVDVGALSILEAFCHNSSTNDTRIATSGVSVPVQLEYPFKFGPTSTSGTWKCEPFGVSISLLSHTTKLRNDASSHYRLGVCLQNLGKHFSEVEALLDSKSNEASINCGCVVRHMRLDDRMVQWHSEIHSIRQKFEIKI
jgi:hypothetical protein